MRALRDSSQGRRRSCVALQDAHALSTGHVPQPQSAILTATEQAAAVRREGEAVHGSAMPMQHRSVAVLWPHPTARSFCPKLALASVCAIRTPSHAIHSLGVPCQRLESQSAVHVPQLDGAIPTAAGQLGAIRGKRPGRAPSCVWPSKRPGAGSWSGFCICHSRMQPSKPPQASTLPIGTPDHSVDHTTRIGSV